MKLIAMPLLAALTACTDGPDPANVPPPAGTSETIFTNGEDPTNPFFVALGTNGRACATCHDVDTGWSVSPTALQARFDASGGTDPIFRPNDGASSPLADVSTLAARRTAYAMLLERGLVRVGRAIPANAEFTLVSVDDPAGFASATELSLFRRPLPATNLRFLSQIMWDAREATLDSQADDATLGHAQAMQVEAHAIGEIVAFESSIYTAVRADDVAGDLASDGATGGAAALVGAPFTIGMNASDGPGFDRDVFPLFAAWASADPSTAQGRRRASIARGEQLFDTRTFRIRNRAGIADQQGTCSTCHDTPRVGDRSAAQPIDIGISDRDQRTDGMPLYTLRNTQTGATATTTDPGYALTTGKWADIGKFKAPVLRGLARRPPYFHNGSEEGLDDVVRFYVREFDVRLSDSEQDDLVAFLSAL